MNLYGPGFMAFLMVAQPISNAIEPHGQHEHTHSGEYNTEALSLERAMFVQETSGATLTFVTIN